MPDPQKPKPKRTQILVDPELQIGISTHVIAWIYVYFLAFSVLANSPAFLAIVSADSRDAAYIAAIEQVRGFARYVVLPLGLTFVAMAIHGIWITHRFAGPIVRFKQTLRDLAAHRLPRPITLREKDYMKDLADEMNSAVASLRDEAVRRKRLAEEHVAVVKELVDTLERCPDDLSTALTRAYAALDGAQRIDRQAEIPAGGTPGAAPAATATATSDEISRALVGNPDAAAATADVSSAKDDTATTDGAAAAHTPDSDAKQA